MLKARILVFALLISITPVLAADRDDGGHRKWHADVPQAYDANKGCLAFNQRL